MAPAPQFLPEPSLDGVRLFGSPSFEGEIDSAKAKAPPAPGHGISPDHPALRGSLTPPPFCPAPKVLNFSPGPTNLPPAVEAAIQRRCFPAPSEMRLGSMALSHRSPEFGRILERAVSATRRVMEIPAEYEILFTQGGGHGQFAAVPMNLCSTGREAATYVVNGTWSKRAVEEAGKYCRPKVISALNDDGSCTSFPSLERIEREIDPDSQFLYVCSNETVNGIELHRLPPRLASGVPLVVDASSDFTSKPVAWRESNVGVLFACASKNIGHPGITAVVVRRDLLGRANPFTPGIFNYETNILADNVWNTIPTFNVDVVGIMMEWLLEGGGARAAEGRSIAKSDLLYDLIDGSDGFFSTPVDAAGGHRSRMNVPFCVAGGDESLTDLFLVECWERGIVGLRTVTPFGKSSYLRASLYHGVSHEEVVVLADFMREFAARHSASEAGEAEVLEAKVSEGVSEGGTSKVVSMKEIVAGCSAAEAEVSETEFSVATAATSLSTLPESPTSRDLDSPAAFDRALDSVNANGGLFAQLSSSPDTVVDRALDDADGGLFARLSSSPDTVADPALAALTLPKNLKVREFSRVTGEMFNAPPSPPPSLGPSQPVLEPGLR